MKYIDPSGLDQIICGGSGSTADDGSAFIWNNYAMDTFAFDPVYFLPDNGPDGFMSWDIRPRMQQLCDEMNKGHKDIKLIGYSEGAATVGTFMSWMADYPDWFSPSLINDIRAVVLLECPTGWGTDSFVNGYDYTRLINLPDRFSGYNIHWGDIWNAASLVHRSQIWRDEFSYPYDSNPARRVLSPANALLDSGVNTWKGNYHSHIWDDYEHNRNQMNTMFKVINGVAISP